MAVTFCPLILQARSKDLDFGSALQASTCANGRWELVFPGKGKALFQCAWWDENIGDCAVHHITRLVQQPERPRGTSGGRI